jgi:arylsulfatase A-like enzyme
MYGPSYHNRYAGQLSYVDHYLGRVFASLSELGVWEETLIVIFADHGTEFAEHGFYEKKVNLYNEILSVPLIFHCPSRLPAGRVVEGLVETAQVAPTIAELAGLDPLPTAQSNSLVDRLRGTGNRALPYVCSHTRHEHQRDGGPAQFDHYAIQTPSFKLIRLQVHVDPGQLHSDWQFRMQATMIRTRQDPGKLRAGTVIRELYDLRFDPQEQRSLLATGIAGPYPRQVSEKRATAIAAGLEAELDAWIEHTAAARPD